MAGYLEILEETLLCFHLPTYEAKLRVRERKHPKWYWCDPSPVIGQVDGPTEYTQSIMPQDEILLFCPDILKSIRQSSHNFRCTFILIGIQFI